MSDTPDPTTTPAADPAPAAAPAPAPGAAPAAAPDAMLGQIDKFVQALEQITTVAPADLPGALERIRADAVNTRTAVKQEVGAVIAAVEQIRGDLAAAKVREAAMAAGAHDPAQITKLVDSTADPAAAVAALKESSPWLFNTGTPAPTRGVPMEGQPGGKSELSRQLEDLAKSLR